MSDMFSVVQACRKFVTFLSECAGGGKNDLCFCSTGQQQGQEGVKVQPGPVTVTVGNLTNTSLNAVSPDQLGQAQSPSEQEGQPSKRLRRVACSCPNCRDGEGR